MTERLLQFIWQFQYYNKNELTTTSGERLTILFQGQYNQHQGPDFLEARIRIQNEIWAGNIELHINSSDWHKHFHSNDRNYGNVILHVVWNDDKPLPDRHMQTLELNDRVAKVLIQQYEEWLSSDYFIPCGSHIETIDSLTWRSWKERLLVERLTRKSILVRVLLEQNNFNWEQTYWCMIARNFGLFVNAEAFGEIAVSVPYNLLLKHAQQLHQLEAILYGQAGMLEVEFNEEYPRLLKKEYKFLLAKYNLVPKNIAVHYLRMRPAGFPTVRLAQLAMLIYLHPNLFSSALKHKESSEIRQMLNLTAGTYWDTHFTFDQRTKESPKKLGRQMTDSIMINTIIPLLFAYGDYRREDVYKLRAVEWAGVIAPEKNVLTDKFQKLGAAITCAGDSQAMIELKSQYCDFKKCLDCAVGNFILNRPEMV